MKHISWTKFGGSLIAILGFVFFGNTAFADYEAFSNKLPIPAISLSGDPEYQMFGNTWVVEYVATSTIKRLDRIDVPLCRVGGTTGGTIELEIRSTASTTGIIVASSTLSATGGNVWSTGCATSFVNATTSTFILNNKLDTVEGVTWWMRFRFVGTTGTYYMSMQDKTHFGDTGIVWIDGGSSPFTYSGTTYSMAMTGRGLGYAPIVATSTEENIECDTFYDIYCYGVKAISWTLRPSTDDWILISNALDELKSDLLYMWPLGYYTDFFYYFETETGTSSLVVIDTQIPQGLPCAGCTIYLDATNGLDMLLNATTGQFALVGEPTENQTFYEITSPYWNKIMVVLVILYIVGRILGFSVTLNNSVTKGGQTYYKGRTTIK